MPVSPGFGERNEGSKVRLIPWGLILSAIWSAILLVTGWLGGELSYRYGIGMQVGDEEPVRRDRRAV
jgi:uncharacterized membrane protein